MLVKNNIIPFKGFIAINLFGIVFVRRKEWERLTSARQEKILRHEAIHTRQMVELLVIGFYVLYLLEWAYWLVFRPMNAYRHISFEREAYDNERNKTYLETRRHFAQWKKNEEIPLHRDCGPRGCNPCRSRHPAGAHQVPPGGTGHLQEQY